MRRGLLSRIEREIEHQREHGNGQIIIKCNHLVDEGLIRALYRASQAGVRIDLQVRGICCLRPGLPGGERKYRRHLRGGAFSRTSAHLLVLQ